MGLLPDAVRPVRLKPPYDYATYKSLQRHLFIVNKIIPVAIAVVLIIVIALAAFVSMPRKEPAYGPAVEIVTEHGTSTVQVEVANTPEMREQGLMNRPSLGPEAGMLFVFDDMNMRYFWMENTLIPLDMIFISADGTVVSVRENTTPLSRDLITSVAPCRFVLEVNGGYCREHGVSAGNKVEMSAR
jgi:uncharacterized membrane protein (UPF0127 family)